MDTFSREDFIEWLSWNDPNGIYEDEQSMKELNNIITIEEGREIMSRQIRESRPISQT